MTADVAFFLILLCNGACVDLWFDSLLRCKSYKAEGHEIPLRLMARRLVFAVLSFCFLVLSLFFTVRLEVVLW